MSPGLGPAELLRNCLLDWALSGANKKLPPGLGPGSFLKKLQWGAVFLCQIEYGGVVPDADQVLEDGEEVGLGRGVHHQVLHQLETLIHIIQLQPNIVEPLSKFMEILLLVFIEHFELSLQILALVILQSLEHVDEAIPHELVAEVDPEVEVVGAGDEGVDEGEARHAEGLVVSDQQP